MSDSKILINGLSPQIKPLRTNSGVLRKFDRLVKDYIDEHAEVLMEPHFAKRLYFDHGKDGDGEHTKPVFELFDLKGQQVSSLIKQMKRENIVVLDQLTRPLHWLLTVWLRELVLIAKETKLRSSEKNQIENTIENIIAYMIFGWWWTLQIKYFPFVPNENIVAYTVSRLSGKFKIRQYGSGMDALIASSINHFKKHVHELESGTDEDIKNFVSGQWSRLNSIFKNFAREVMKDHEQGNYINPDTDEQAEKGDDGRPEREMTTYSGLINEMTLRTVDRLFNSVPDQKAINLSAKLSGNLNEHALKDSIQSMLSSFEYDYLKDIVSSIIVLYVIKGGRKPSQIYSRDYIEYVYEIYSRSNTRDETVLKIKEKLDEILKVVSDLYIKTQRRATKTRLRKSIFLYFALMIQQSNRNTKLF